MWLDASELDILRGRLKAPKAASDGEGIGRGILADVAFFFGQLFI